MANIVLPRVDILDSIKESANILVEQDGSIKRFAVVDLDIGSGDITVDLSNESIGEPNKINADTLGGQLPEYYATATMVSNITNNITPDTIGAVSKNNVVNNFTTTQEGFVADARTLKALNDMLTPQTVDVAILDCAKLESDDSIYAYRIGNIIVFYALFRFVPENMKQYMGNSRLFKLPFNLKRGYFWTHTRGDKSQLIEVRSNGEFWCNYQDTMSTDVDKTAGFTCVCVIDN